MNVKKVENSACGKLVLGIMLVAPLAGQACAALMQARQPKARRSCSSRCSVGVTRHPLWA